MGSVYVDSCNGVTLFASSGSVDDRQGRPEQFDLGSLRLCKGRLAIVRLDGSERPPEMPAAGLVPMTAMQFIPLWKWRRGER